jgi:uncharacterized protein (DUF1697 family)
MGRTHYIALLRGINVGGNNLIKMTELKACFEANGYGDVSTYIQSGNVLFSSDVTDTNDLATAIERMLGATFTYAEPRVVVVSHAQLKEVVHNAPTGFGSEPALYRYNVIFFKAPLTPAEAAEGMEAREGVDAMHTGKHTVYFSNLIAKATQSRLNRIIGTPAYRFMTIRNWNTTTKLLALLDAQQS